MIAMSDTASIALRFPLGARVECKAEHKWTTGTVIAYWYTQSSFPKGMCVPYQVELDNGKLMYAPRDDDNHIRASVAAKPKRSGPTRKLPAGKIDQMMMPIPKAHAYVDLMLAPSGEAMLMGEPAMMTAALGSRGFDGALMGCTTDELEMVAAVMAFTRIGQGAVRDAMLRRAPESLGALCAFIAYTPDLSDTPQHIKEERGMPNANDGWSFEGSIKNAMSRHPDNNRVRLCEFTSRNPSGKGAPFNCKEVYLSMSPPQRDQCYCTVMAACLQALLTVCDPDDPGATHAMRQLQACPAFVPCVQRLMELVARWGEPGAMSTGKTPDHLNCGQEVFRLWAVSPGSGGLPPAALWVLARMCAHPDAPRVRWLLRAHRAFERRYVPAGDCTDKTGPDYWQPLPPPGAVGAENQPSSFIGVLFRAVMGTLDTPLGGAAARVKGNKEFHKQAR